ncbi:hypothetical protein [Chryseobacterium gossypii]|uniref:hypothetical protein n=1 Tax=Chryseobacterium gossypii TaxID=3231602 RepID=UPI003524D5C7
MKPKQIYGVPEQKHGGFHDTESEKEFENPSVATQKFAVLKERFFSVNNWVQYCGEGSADFKLYDSNGNRIDRTPEIGDFMRIDIPGPGTAESKGYDWVKVINISHKDMNDSEVILMSCRPSTDPCRKENHHIAHFYSDKATSTFMISRNGNSVKAAIYGRNETPNFNATFIDKIRNIMIAVGGMMRISKIQWKCLSDGLLNFE